MTQLSTCSGRYDRWRDLARAGSTFLEVQIAMILLAVGLSGIVPIVVVQSRQAQRLQTRIIAEDPKFVAPVLSKWAGKLGVAAQIVPTLPSESPPIRPQIIDDYTPGFAVNQRGAYLWSQYSFAPAYGGDIALTYATGDNDHVQWTFSGLAPGMYEVFVTFYSWSVSASLAPYTIFDGTTSRGTVNVNQQIVPNDISLEGMPWRRLGDFNIQSGTLRIRLRDQTTGYLSADAVFIQPRRNAVNVLNLTPNQPLGRAISSVRVLPGN